MSRPDEIRPNDVVVCVDARANPITGKTGLKRGRHYRVTGVGTPNYNALYGRICGQVTVAGVIVTLHSRCSGYLCSERFRRLDAAEDCFTQAMRRLIPLETEVT